MVVSLQTLTGRSGSFDQTDGVGALKCLAAPRGCGSEFECHYSKRLDGRQGRSNLNV